MIFHRRFYQCSFCFIIQGRLYLGLLLLFRRQEVLQGEVEGLVSCWSRIEACVRVFGDASFLATHTIRLSLIRLVTPMVGMVGRVGARMCKLWLVYIIVGVIASWL